MEKKARKLDRRLLMVGISAVALVLISGICLEILLEIPERIHCSRQPHAAIPAMEQLQTEGFSLEGEGLSLTEESGSVRIDLSGQYVRQFVVSYDYQALMNFTAEVFLINA